LAEAILCALAAWTDGGTRMAPSAGAKAELRLRTMDETISDLHVIPMPGTVMFTSPNNPGALEFAELLATMTKHLSVVTAPPQERLTRISYTESSIQRNFGRRVRNPVAQVLVQAPDAVVQITDAVVQAATRPVSEEQPRPSHRNNARDLGDLGRASHFLLFLNDQAFVGDAGIRLASELRVALSLSMPIVLVHETRIDRGGVSDFDRFFHVTPADLARGGLYKDIATSLHASERHLAVELSLIARKLGAQRVTRRDGSAAATPLMAARAHLGMTNEEDADQGCGLTGRRRTNSKGQWHVLHSVALGLRSKARASKPSSPSKLSKTTRGMTVGVAQQSCSAASAAKSQDVVSSRDIV